MNSPMWREKTRTGPTRRGMWPWRTYTLLCSMLHRLLMSASTRVTRRFARARGVQRRFPRCIGGGGKRIVTVIRWHGGKPRLIPLVGLCKVGDGLDRTARRRLKEMRKFSRYMGRPEHTSWVPLQVPVEDSLCHLEVDTRKREGREYKVKEEEVHVTQTPP